MTSNSQFQGISASSPQKNRPTVPMSVYRELAAELQTTKHQLEQVKQENRQLHQQNDSLRLEIRQLAQSVQKIETLISDWQLSPTNWGVSEKYPNEEAKITPEPTYEFPDYRDPNWLTHQDETSPKQVEPPQRSQQVNGWFLLAVIAIIIVTFSGIGFMVACPLINQSGK